MSAEFDWTGLKEISGFGGEYEETCRKMVKAGVEWLRAHPGADLRATHTPGVFPDLWGGTPDFKAFQDAMVEGGGDGDCTGAQVCVATHHAMLIHRKGWDEYAEMGRKDGANANMVAKALGVEPLTAELAVETAEAFADYFGRSACVGEGVCTAGDGTSVLVARHADLKPDGTHRRVDRSAIELMEDSKLVPIRLDVDKLRAVCKAHVSAGRAKFREAEEAFEKECNERHFHSDTKCPACGERIIVPGIGDDPVGYEEWYEENRPKEEGSQVPVWVRFGQGDAAVPIPYSPLRLANIFNVELRLHGIIRCAMLKMEDPHHVLVFIGEHWRACLVPRHDKPDPEPPADEVVAMEGGEP